MTGIFNHFEFFVPLKGVSKSYYQLTWRLYYPILTLTVLSIKHKKNIIRVYRHATNYLLNNLNGLITFAVTFMKESLQWVSCEAQEKLLE